MSNLDAQRDLVRGAILALVVLPDVDSRWRRRRSGWLLPTIQDARYAYGALPARERFQPSAREISAAEALAPALAALRRSKCDSALRLLTAWAVGVPCWRLAQRQGVTERTIRNRVDRLVVAPLALDGNSAVLPEAVEEPAGKEHSLAFTSPKAPTLTLLETCDGQAHPRKVWVGDCDGGHWRKNGVRWKDGN